MQSSTAEPTIDETDDQVSDTPVPAPSPLIFLEPVDDAGVCTTDGWCA
ncbi:hypothetical protein [Catenuloplanes japonicus]|nr:hypothetical protein [Catenuloplanes japonicus]